MRTCLITQLFLFLSLTFSASVHAATLIASFNLDEGSWTGSIDEVIDSSGNGHHGSVLAGSTAEDASPVKASPVGTCGYVKMNKGSIAVTGLPVSLVAGDKTTVSFWMRWDGTNSVMPLGWGYHDLWIFDGDFGFNSAAGDLYGVASAGLANGWHHVSAEFTNGNMHANRLVIDGEEKLLSQKRGGPSNSRAYVSDELRIGGWKANTGYRFSGDIDEVRVHSGVLSVAEVGSLMNDTRPCEQEEPIADWHLDELAWQGVDDEVEDFTGNKFHGVASKGTTTTLKGKLCNAADLTANTISDYVTLDPNTMNGLDDFSISLWATFSNFPTALISGANSGQNNELLIFTTKSTEVALYNHGSTLRFTTPNLNDGEFHHLVWSRSGDNNCLYIDGSLIQCSDRIRAATLKVEGLILGQEQDNVGGGFDINQEHEALLDEVSIYNRAIADDEVKTIFKNINAGNNADGTARRCSGEPLAKWSFDELYWTDEVGGVRDTSANSLHGQSMFKAYTDATSPAVSGSVGTCGYGVFDGTAGNQKKQHIKLPSDSVLNKISDQLTLTGWVNISKTGSYNYLISNARDCCGSYKGFSLRVNGSNLPEFQIWDTSGIAHSVYGPRLKDSQWYHLSATFDGQEMRIYVDGELSGTTKFVGKIGTDSSFDTVLAGLGVAPDRYNLTGLLDEVRVYDVALDQIEIQEVMKETRACDAMCELDREYLLFEDNFDDGDYADWEVHRFNGKGCNWTISNGQLKEQRNSCHGFLGHGLKSTESSLKNYVIKASVDARPTGGNNGVGIVFGYVDDSNYYLVQWRDYGSAYTSNSRYRDFELIKVSNGVTTTLDKKIQHNLPDTFEMTIDVSEDKGIDIYINCDLQTLGLQALGEAPQIQEFGLYTRDNDSAIYYDNVEVYGKALPLPDPLLLLHLDGTNWSTAVDSIVDSSGNNHHGQVISNTSASGTTPVVSSNPGTCGYASLSSGSIRVNDLPVSTTAGAKTTVSFWMKWDGTNSVMPIGWDTHDLWIVSGHFGFNSGQGDVFGISSDGLANSWHHISAEFTNGDLLANRLVVDGVEKVVTQRQSSPANTRAYVQPSLSIGGWSRSSGYRFRGDIDEVRVDNGTLTIDQVNKIMKQTHPCGNTSLDHFRISHDGAGLHCLTETVLVSAKTQVGDTFKSYTGTITLDTQTGSGSWIATTGRGSLNDAVANDGMATYTFSEADQGATTFTLSYEDGPAVFNIDVYDGTIRDDDSEEDFTYTASGFIFTANQVSNPPPTTINDPILTQISGKDFSFYMTAYGQSPTHPECGVIENYSGDKPIRFQGDYINPSSGSRSISIGGTDIRMGGLDSSRTIKFVNGVAQLSANYKDAGSMRIRAYDTSVADNIYGYSNTFIVKPNAFKFEITRSSDAAINPAALDAAGDIFVTAGESFTLKVLPVDLQGDITQNYGNESTSESIKVSHRLIAPNGGSAGTLSGSMRAAGNGVFSGDFTWSEVGLIQVDAEVLDGDYLGSGNIFSSSNNIGRFIPDHFTIENKQDGALNENCSIGTSAGFSYIGQDFGYSTGNQPAFDVRANNVNGTVTENYEGSFAKLNIPGVTIPSITEDATNSDTITHTQAAGNFSAFNKGIATYTVGLDEYIYDRNNTPVGIFDSDIQLEITSVEDSDGVKDNFTSAELLQPMATELRYGRLMIGSAFGSELVDLGLPISLQVYDDVLGDFRTDTDPTNHTCAAFSVLPLEQLDTLDPTLVTESSSAFVNGESALTITAPGAGNVGSLGVTLDAPEWLEFDWGRPLTDTNRTLPKATATFGIHGGNDAFIYQRELR